MTSTTCVHIGVPPPQISGNYDVSLESPNCTSSLKNLDDSYCERLVPPRL